LPTFIFFGERFLFNYLILGLIFPFATAILPLFIKIRDLGLLDMHWGIIPLQVAFGLAISVLLLRNAFRQLPVELIESSLRTAAAMPVFRLDHPAAVAADPGRGRDHRLRDELEQFPLAARRAQHAGQVTLAARAHGLPGQYMAQWNLVLAFITLTILPAIGMFLIAQKHIVAGLTAGAVKG
jgi:raffinose/stachyose/melibiose transport system permease protein